MSIFKAIFVGIVFFPPMFVCAQNVAASGPVPAPTAVPASDAFTPAPPSDILQRPLEEVQQTVASVKLDKWKRGSVRDEAGNNIEAIKRYMQGTLPSMIKEADASPGTLSKMLPVSRNIDALYDVLLHVVEAARVSAPGDQVGPLQQALADLEKARVALGNQLQQTATVQEKQIVELRTTVQTQAASLKAEATPPPAPKCPVPVPAKKKKTPAKSTTTPATTAKPAAGTPANPAGAAPANPPKPQ